MNSGTTTTTQESRAPAYQRNLFRTASNDAMSMYKAGTGLNTGSMVVPYSQQSQSAFKQMMAGAKANSGPRGLSGNMQDIINNGGFNDYQKGALNNWQNTANSSYDFNANPGSQGVLDSILRDTRDSVNLNAASAGRYGSGLHQGRLAQDIGDVSSQYRMQDYNNWLGRRDAANSNLFNGAQAGLGNMTAAYQGMQAPQQTKLAVGTAMEDQMRRQLDDQARMRNLPWDNLQRLLAAGGGMGSYGTTTTQAPGPNPFLQGLGMVGTAGNFLWGSNTGGLLGQFNSPATGG